MSESISDQIINQIRSNGIGQISQQLGANEQQTESAIGAAVPLLLSALGKNAQDGGGAQSLFNALLSDHGGADKTAASGGFDIGSLVGSVLGASSSNAASGGSGFNASGILSNILGSNLGRVEETLSQASGISSAGIQKLLAILAPIVMGFLGKQVAQGSAQTPDALGSLLGNEAEKAQSQGGVVSSLLSSVLDQNGDGKLDGSDLLKFGASLFAKK